MSKNKETIKGFQVGEKIYGNYLVKNLSLGITVQNKTYMDITLGDNTGDIVGKLWDVTFDAEQLEVGDLAYATGLITEWNGEKQLRLDHVEKYTGVYDVSDYVVSSPYSTTEMDTQIGRYIEALSNPEIQSVVSYLYEKNRKEFLIAPAARSVHHGIYGGLAYHTLTMLKTASKLLDVYTFLDKDLLYAGVILHDMAKVDEMEHSNGTATDYTRGGFLLGHIVQGTMMIENAAAELKIDERTKEVLQHMVVSHHEKGEWGSPQPPRIPEAVMLHFIDNIDAKMYIMKDLIENKEEGEYTNYHKTLRQKFLVF